jgi:HD-like signal output (HDOD) protein
MTGLSDVQRRWLDHRFRAMDMGHPAAAALRAAVAGHLERGAPVVHGGWHEPEPSEIHGVPRLCNLVPEPCDSGPPPDIRQVVSTACIPPLPSVFHTLQSQLEDPAASPDDIAWTISMDPRLTASLLRLVNSPLFGLRVKVDTVSRAVAILGAKHISTLAAGTLLLGLFHERPPRAIDIDEFWRHSVACGLAARTLAICAGHTMPERHFVGGLLHDIGWLALCCGRPDLACAALRHSGRTGCALHEAEQHCFGFDHAGVAYALAQQWELPATIASAMRWHHQPPADAKGQPVFDAAVVHVADVIVHAMGYSVAADQFAPALEPYFWNDAEVPVESLDVVVRTVYAELELMVDLLQP